MKSKLIVGTRGSKLALVQTKQVIDELIKFYPKLNIDIKIIKTTGDMIFDRDLSKIGGKGLFIKEIEEALLRNEIDFAVHSMKDVPHTLPIDFQIGAILKREDPKDVLIARNNLCLKDLQIGSIIGTGSLRRMLQLHNIRPDLNIKPIRGNIDTRISKLVNGEFEGIIIAAAGLKRLGWKQANNEIFFNNLLKNNANLGVEYLEADNFIPAVGQGALAIEIRDNDSEVFNIIKILNNHDDAICVETERAFLKEIDGGCEIPIGAYATLKDEEITLSGFIGDEKKLAIFSDIITDNIKYHKNIGINLAKRLKTLKNNNI